MPSDSKKKEQLKKREAAKQRQAGRGKSAAASSQQKADDKPEDQNENVDEQQEESASATNSQAEEAASASASASAGNGDADDENAQDLEDEEDEDEEDDEDAVAEGVKALSVEEDEQDGLDPIARAAKHRAVVGVLGSHPDSRDLHVHGLTVHYYSHELLSDAKLELNYGRRYGLVGANGVGKSTLLDIIANREIPIPSRMDIFLLKSEMEASTLTPLEAVMAVDEERARLDAEAEELASHTDDESQQLLMDIYDRLEELDADKAEAKAARILKGLGFTKTMQKQKQVKEFSGGWRMRIALARALFVRPHLLLLDEPTNHLDMQACVWLERELNTYKRILLIISHSQDFLNGVCTNIISMHRRKLFYYSGNYNAFVKTKEELLEHQAKRFKYQQMKLAHLKDFVARFGHGTAKLAAQAKSREKMIGKMVAGGMAEQVVEEKNLQFGFPLCGELAPPIIMIQRVSFRYAPDQPWIYRNLDMGVDLQTRVALVGPNGAGKSTFLKLVSGDLVPSDGLVRRHSHVKIARYYQHMNEQMDMSLSGIDWMRSAFPGREELRELEDARKFLGRFGLTGKQQLTPIRNLSHGQRARIVFACIAMRAPHILLLDEPTNSLDIETIDSLADAINAFDGGVVLVSHDFRLISQVAKIIWLCEGGNVKEWPGDIYSYKEHILKRVRKFDHTLGRSN